MSSDFLIRSLTSDANGFCEVAAHGFGIEVLDGGNFERGNVIELGRGDRNYDASFSGDNLLACNPGARIAGEFDTLKLVVQNPAIVDTVKVKIITAPSAVWCDSEPNGKARVKWLARGRANIGAMTGLKVYDSGTLGEPDRYSTAEVFEVFNYWGGYIAGRRAFNVIVQVKPYNVAGATFQIQQNYSARDYTGLPAGFAGDVPTGAAFVHDWTHEGGTVDTQLTRYPIGQVQVFVLNIDAGNAANYTWMIGVRSI